MKSLVLLVCLSSLCGCSTPPSDPFTQVSFPQKPQPQIYYQVYGFQLGERESKIPSLDSVIVDSKYAESLALSGPPESLFSLVRAFKEYGIDFEAAGSFISLDPTVDGILRIGSPYRRYYIVVANTEKNLNRADIFIHEKMKGTLLDARKKIP